MEQGQVDSLVLAAAGLNRLGFTSITHLFEPEKVAPSATQGILALQCREDDATVQKILQNITQPHVKTVAAIERGAVTAISGSCHTPLGVYVNQQKR